VVVQGCPIYLYVSREAFKDDYAITSCRLQYRSVVYMIEMKRAADFMNASTSSNEVYFYTAISAQQ
jgi:hypothetical protein